MKLSREESGNLFEALGRLISAGISLGDSFTLLSEEAEGEYKALLCRMADDADNGKPLCEIIGQSGVFESYPENILSVASQTGKQDKALYELSRHYKSRHRMMKSLRASITSPLFLLGLLAVITAVLLIWVLPMFNEVYASLGGGLNGFAGWLLSLGNGLRAALPWVLPAVALIIILVMLPPINKKLKAFIKARFGDRGANRKINSSAFISALSMAISSGMTEEAAAEISLTVSDGECEAFEARCRYLAEKVKSGESLSKALREGEFITLTQARQLEIGRRSGKLDEAVANLAEESREAAEEAMEKALGLIEPTIVGVACVMIGGILLSVMLPLISIMNSIG